jgi:hypothetical protein
VQERPRRPVLPSFPCGKYILDGHTPVPCEDVLEWGAWYEDPSHRRVGLTDVGMFHVSTVFLGIDHNFQGEGAPILFESMVFYESGKKGDGVLDLQRRYATWEEAERGHERVIGFVRENYDSFVRSAQKRLR